MRSRAATAFLHGALAAAVLLLSSRAARAADWPAWRYDAGRTAASPERLPRRLHLQWTRKYPKLAPAWPDEPRMEFDHEYRPVVMGKTMFVASPRSDSVTALNTETGEEKWRFYADGPVRFAPCCWKGKVFFTSDDGYLYCLAADDGKLLWKYAGAPHAGRKIIGNQRLISAWPARGGPVIYDGTVYFAAGIWPFMGVFVHAVDAATGRKVWTNAGTGSIFMSQPHSSPAFAGLAPQGYLAVNGNRLLVPNGRAVAACLDRKTGRLLYFRLARNNRTGSYFVATSGKYFFNRKEAYALADGRRVGQVLSTPVLTPDALYSAGRAFDYARARPGTVLDERGYLRPDLKMRPLWDFKGAAGGKIWIKAGSKLVAAHDRKLMVLEMRRGRGAPRLAWQTELAAPAASVLAADGKLFVVTSEGELLCFGGRRVEPKKWPPRSGRSSRGEAAAAASIIFKNTGVNEGYCVLLGVRRDGEFARQLAQTSKLHVIAIDPDAGKVAAARRSLGRFGQYGYGSRIAVLQGDVNSLRLPPYLANLVVSDGPGVGKDPASLKKVFRLLRPYGGTAHLWGTRVELARAVKAAGLTGAEIKGAGNRALLVRKGRLPGAGQWTHEYANAANTVVSTDTRVRAPLGLLWFGGSSNAKILPRHGHGPVPQVAAGRLLIEGPDMLRALDVYTGRVLWEAELPGLGKYYDNVKHQPGANALGSNYVSLPDAIYVAYGTRCLVLDPKTGKTVKEFKLPREKGAKTDPAWGYIGVEGDVLLAGARPLEFYDPDFTPDEFLGWEYTPEDFAKVLAWIKALKGFKPIPKGKEESDAVYAARNLNRLLGEKRLIARLAGAPEANLGAIARKIELYVRARPKLPAGDIKLREMNRGLLYAFMKAIPENVPVKPGGWSAALTSSRRLVALDRGSGKVLWSLTARQGFLHNAIAAGGGKVFCVDRYPPKVIKVMKFKGKTPAPGRLTAMALRTGRELWKTDKDVSGTWLSYSAKHDVLLHAARPSRDNLPERGEQLRTYRGASGKVLWEQKVNYDGPCLLHGETIITQGGALDLLTGKIKVRRDPITGGTMLWHWTRKYGCGTAIASQHLLTFRSAAAGYYDLAADGGTGNFGGFKSGCTANLIIADGVLAAPDYTRTCTCSYHNQTSLGLIHDPEVEMWTFNDYQRPAGAVRRAGINFGAPGDRRAGSTLWLDWPSVGGRSPDLRVWTNGSARTFRNHPTQMKGKGLKWVAASGLRRVTRLHINLGRGPARTYTVRLYFCEPDDKKPGERVFNVMLQGRKVLKELDIAKEAGGPRRLLVKEFKGIRVKGLLTATGSVLNLRFESAVKGTRAVISGLEVILEKPAPTSPAR